MDNFRVEFDKLPPNCKAVIVRYLQSGENYFCYLQNDTDIVKVLIFLQNMKWGDEPRGILFEKLSETNRAGNSKIISDCSKRKSWMLTNEVKTPYRLFVLSFFVETKTTGQYDGLAIDILNADRGQNNCVSPQKLSRIGRNFAVCSLFVDHKEAPIVFISGGSGNKFGRQFIECDVLMRKWKKRPPMNFPRYDHSMISVNGKIFVLGGKQNGEIVSHVEKYDKSSKKWQTVCSLTYPVHSSACISYNGVIYLFGGKNSKNENLFVIQSVRPESRESCVCGFLPFECSGGRAEVVGDQICVASSQGHFIKFDPLTNKTTVLESLPMVSPFVSFVKDSEFHVVFSADSSTNQQYRYSRWKESWVRVTDHSIKGFHVDSAQCVLRMPSYVLFWPFID